MDFPPMNEPQTINKGRWQWQSNSDPWSKSEEPQWTDYLLSQNYLIEKAYYEQQKEVELGDYIISIKHMIQKKKGDIVSQRSIRRIDWLSHLEEIDRSERYFETELPKTINKIFGSLEDLVDFFSRRNAEILDFNKQFKELEQLNDLNGLNRQIIPKLIDCLEGELTKRTLGQLVDQSISSVKKKILLEAKNLNEKLILSFTKGFSSFEEFYGQILRAYTMNTDLYANLNKYLREESWIDIDNLLPYIFCFCRAFFSLKRKTILSEHTKEQETKEGSIYLYRGTALGEFALRSYDVKKIHHFSWYSVTSTSFNKQIAENFMYQSGDIKEKKYPVMFIIEVPATDGTMENSKWIDVHQYSAIPKEKEVVLPPGSVFELQEVLTDKNQITTIKLKLINKVRSLAYEGVIMQGTLHREMMTDKEMKIMCLEGEELNEAFKSLSGNKLIEELEFCLCIFDNKSLGTMMEILATMEKTKALKFISCTFKDEGEIGNKVFLNENKDFQISKVEISEINDFYKVLGIKNSEGKSLIPVKKLDLSFRNMRHIKDAQLNNDLFKEFKHLTQLTSLSLDFYWCSQLTDEGMQSLAFDGFESLTELTSLSLNFSSNQLLTEKGVSSFAFLILKPLTKLTSLALGFKGNRQIRDNPVATLGFKGDQQIRDNTVHLLVSHGFKYLTHLASLTLSFSGNCLISNKGVESLASTGLQYLTQLAFLTLIFEGNHWITDSAIKSLASSGLKKMTRLTDLTLDFQGCKKITNKGIKILASEGLRYLTQLKDLKLDFCDNRKITDEGVFHLITQGLKYLDQLENLTLDLAGALVITEEGVDDVLQILKNRNQLIAIFVSFDYEPQERLEASPMRLIYQRFPSKHNQFQEDQSKYPLFAEKSLQNQMLSKSSKSSTFLEESEYIVTQHLVEIANSCPSKDLNVPKEILNHFNQIEFLDLNFFRNDTIGDEIINILASQGFKYLVQLKSLTLQFSGTMTSKGKKFRLKPWPLSQARPSFLAFKGLQYLTELTHLNLDFSKTQQITDEGIKNLATQGLKHLSKLASLTLKFSESQLITDEGMNSLASYGLRNLVNLTSLYLDFQRCMQISDEGVNSLTSQLIKYLPRLTYLALDFENCDNITEFTLCNIIRVLRYFGFSIKK